jgi:hypothetical protein
VNHTAFWYDRKVNVDTDTITTARATNQPP